MSFSSTSTRSVLSAVAVASALAVGSGAAVAAPVLPIGQTSVDNNPTAQIASTGDPTAFSQIAHEQSAHGQASSDHARLAEPADAGNARAPIADPTAFEAMAHEHDGVDSSARASERHADQGITNDAIDGNRYQQPNQAWAG